MITCVNYYVRMGKTEDRLEVIEIQLNGDPKDNDDNGLRGKVYTHENKIKSLELTRKEVWRWVSGVILALLIAACTYFFNSITNGGSNDNSDNYDNSTDVMDDTNELRRGRANHNTSNTKPYQYGD